MSDRIPPLVHLSDLSVDVQPREYRMTAVEIAVKALVDLCNDEVADASVRCSAACALLTRKHDDELLFIQYDEQGQKVAA